MEFKEALIQIGECMEAGYSVENSFAESYFLCGKDSAILRTWYRN